MEIGLSVPSLTPVLQPKRLNPNTGVSDTENLFPANHLMPKVGKTTLFSTVRTKKQIQKPNKKSNRRNKPTNRSNFLSHKFHFFPLQWRMVFPPRKINHEQAAAKACTFQTGGKACSAVSSVNEYPVNNYISCEKIRCEQRSTFMEKEIQKIENSETITISTKKPKGKGIGNCVVSEEKEKVKGRCTFVGPTVEKEEMEKNNSGVSTVGKERNEKENGEGMLVFWKNGEAISFFSSRSNANMGQTHSPWIFDCRATDTMTYDSSDIISPTLTNRTHIQTANGECVGVTQAGTIDISPSIHLKNCLLIPSLSHKLLSVSQLTKELNCTIIMSSTECVVQDAQTGRIIGHGTDRGGLYYLDEATQKDHTMLAHGSPDHQMWMWHRRLGHPSLGVSLVPANNKFHSLELLLVKEGLRYIHTSSQQGFRVRRRVRVYNILRSFNQKVKLMVEAPGYVISSNTNIPNDNLKCVFWESK